MQISTQNAAQSFGQFGQIIYVLLNNTNLEELSKPQFFDADPK